MHCRDPIVAPEDLSRFVGRRIRRRRPRRRRHSRRRRRQYIIDGEFLR